MPSIAALEDVHGWLMRGFLEAGLSDGTGHSFVPTETGVVDGGDLLALGRGSEGIRLCFIGQAGDFVDVEDEYTYTAKVVRESGRTGIAVRCAETLFYKLFEEKPYETLGARIIAEIRTHNQNFTGWRKRGGKPSYAERQAVPDSRGVPCSAAFSNFLDKHYKAGGTLADGPANGWWNERFSQRALGKQIAMGGGQEAYKLATPLTELEKPENREWVKRVRQAGLGMIASGALCGVWCLGMLVYSAWRWYTIGFGSVFTSGWPLASLLLTGGVGVAQIWAGFQMRGLQSAFWVQGIAVATLIPCWGPCCVSGLPSSLWVLYLMRDPRMERIFES